MRIVVYLLVFVMCMTSACKPIARTSEAYEEDEQRERMSWKKKVLIVAGAGLAVFGSYKMAKYLDRIIGHKMAKDMESMALLQRAAKNFHIEHDKLPLYKLIAPDGSEHWLLGTIHTTGLSLDDLPNNSRLLNAFEETTTFLPEGEIDSAWAMSLGSIRMARVNMQMMKTNFNLRQALGDEYMDKLNDEISQVIKEVKTAPNFGSHAKEVDETLKILSNIDRMPPAHALSILDTLSGNAAFGPPGVAMDIQLTLKARVSGKKVLGLEKVSEAMDKLVASTSEAQPDDSMAIARLRKFIDAGGITNRIREFEEARAAYVNGDAIKANELLTDKIVPHDFSVSC